MFVHRIGGRQWPAWMIACTVIVMFCSDYRVRGQTTLPWTRIYIDDGPSRQAVQKALLGAVQRLAGAECRSLLSEFVDERGRPLANRLEAMTVDVESYLRFIVRRSLFVTSRPAWRTSATSRSTSSVNSPNS